MKKFSLVCILLIVSNLSSQNQKKHMKVIYDFMMNISEKKKFESELHIRDGYSIFLWGNHKREVSFKEEDSNYDFEVSVHEGDSIGSYNITNIAKETIISRTLWFNKEVLQIKENIPKLKWEILEDEKQIGNFNCQKAKTEFRGRTYFAWFTLEIPTNIGPWKFHGLPGLILNITDLEGEVNLYAKKIINLPKEDMPKLPEEEHREISVKEYAELQNNLGKELKKKLMAKLPRGAEVDISSYDTLERFENK